MSNQNPLANHLTESLRVIEINIQLYEAGETAAWMPVATELYKLLVDDKYGALVPELAPHLKLHPVRDQPSSSKIKWLLYSPGINVQQGRIAFDLFDTSAAPLDLPNWLAQELIEVNGIRASIADFVTLMRHNISAHTSRKPLGGKSGIIQRFAVLTVSGIERPGFTRILIDLAIYIVNELNKELGRPAGQRLPLLERNLILRVVQSHNEAKGLMDEIVSGKVALTQDAVASASEKLEFSTRGLIPIELRLSQLLILTHLSEAYRFLYLATRRKLYLVRAISTLESARILLDDASGSRERVLVYFNLGQAYSISTGLLGLLTCWSISLDYYEAAANSTAPDRDPDLYLEAVYQAGWQALKLLRLRTAIKHFTRHRAMTSTKSA